MSVFDLLNSEHYIQNQQIIVDRVNTCNWCSRFFRPTRQCKDCLCFIDAKAKLKTEDCPNGYWDKLN